LPRLKPLLAVLVFLAVLLLISLVDSLALMFHSSLTGLTPEESMVRVMWLLTLLNESILIVAALLSAKTVLKRLPPIALTPRGAGIGVVTGLGGFLIASGLALLICALTGFKPPRWYVEALTPKNNYQLAFSLAVIWGLVGPGEELFFRGFIQECFSDWKGPATSILIASAFFALAHLTPDLWVRSLTSFTVGLLYGFIYERTRSTTPPALAHAINDTLAILTLRWFG